MNVTSQELSEELYRLSGWADPDMPVIDWPDGKRFPAYDAGFLLRQLPPVYEEPSGTRWILKLEISDGYWDCYYLAGSPLQTLSDSPENALAKLAIELIKQGILTPRKEPTDV